MSRSANLAIVFLIGLLSVPASAQQTGSSDPNQNPIQLVIGKQPSSRSTTSSSRNHSRNTGILSGLFGGNNTAQQPQRRPQIRNTQTRQQPIQRSLSDMPSPFVPQSTAQRPSSPSSPSSAQRPSAAPRPFSSGGAQPLMDPEDRAALAAERQQRLKAIPNANNYDTSADTYSSGSASTGRSLSIDISDKVIAREATSSRRSDRRVPSTTAPGPRDVIVAQPTTKPTPVESFPTVQRRPLPGQTVVPKKVVTPDPVIETYKEPVVVIEQTPAPIEVAEPAPTKPEVAQLGVPQQRESAFVPRESTGYARSLNTRSSTTRVPLSPTPQRTYQVPAKPVAAKKKPAPAPVATPAPKVVETKIDAREKKNTRMITSEIPSIRVLTHGPDEIQVNQIAEYSVVVENRGSTDAPGILIRASLPKWTVIRSHQTSVGSIQPEAHEGERRMLWTMKNLPAGASETLTLRLIAERPEVFDVGVEWGIMPQTRVAQVRVHQPRLKLMIEGPDQVVYGDSAIYKVRVMNPGNGIANDIGFTLSPNSATPQTRKIGTLPPGKEAQFEIELTAQDRGGLEIHGLAAGANELRDEAIKNIRVITADLVATLTGPPMKYHNTDAKYNLNLRNDGGAASKSIVAVMRLPQGVTYKSGLQGAEVVGEFLRWKVDEIPAGGSFDYEVVCGMSNVGSHLLAFECRGTAAGRATVSLSTEVKAIADLVLTINDPTAPAPVGEDVTYEIVIRNRGTSPAANVKAIAQFSNGIEPFRLSGHSGEIVPGQVLFDDIAVIDAGQEIKLSVHARATNAAHHRFRAEVTSGETILVAEEATRYIEPSTERISRNSNTLKNR